MIGMDKKTIEEIKKILYDNSGIHSRLWGHFTEFQHEYEVFYVGCSFAWNSQFHKGIVEDIEKELGVKVEDIFCSVQFNPYRIRVYIKIKEMRE